MDKAVNRLLLQQRKAAMVIVGQRWNIEADPLMCDIAAAKSVSVSFNKKILHYVNNSSSCSKAPHY
jgi:hypothetical protein